MKHNGIGSGSKESHGVFLSLSERGDDGETEVACYASVYIYDVSKDYV